MKLTCGPVLSLHHPSTVGLLTEDALHTMADGGISTKNLFTGTYLSVGCLTSSGSPQTYANSFPGVSLRRFLETGPGKMLQ